MCRQVCCAFPWHSCAPCQRRQQLRRTSKQIDTFLIEKKIICFHLHSGHLSDSKDRNVSSSMVANCIKVWIFHLWNESFVPLVYHLLSTFPESSATWMEIFRMHNNHNTLSEKHGWKRLSVLYFASCILSASSLKLKCAWARLASLQQLFSRAQLSPAPPPPPQTWREAGTKYLTLHQLSFDALSMWMGKYKPLRGLSVAHITWKATSKLGPFTIQFNWAQNNIKKKTPYSNQTGGDWMDENQSETCSQNILDACPKSSIQRWMPPRRHVVTPPSSSHEKVRNKYCGICIITWNSKYKSWYRVQLDTQKNASIKYAKLVCDMFNEEIATTTKNIFPQSIFACGNFWFEKAKSTHQVCKPTSGWIRIKIFNDFFN